MKSRPLNGAVRECAVCRDWDLTSGLFERKNQLRKRGGQIGLLSRQRAILGTYRVSQRRPSAAVCFFVLSSLMTRDWRVDDSAGEASWRSRSFYVGRDVQYR